MYNFDPRNNFDPGTRFRKLICYFVYKNKNLKRKKIRIGPLIELK